MRILFVENHVEFARQVCAAFLKDHDVAVVPTLAKARESLESSAWDAVLIDYDLDDGKGVGLVKELASLPTRPKLIAVSAFDEKNAEMLAAGADATCGKLQFSKIADVLA